MADVTLRRITTVGAVDQRQFGSGIANSAGAQFKRNDLIALIAASGEWEKADADWDVAASSPLFALAISNPHADAFTVPIYDSGGSEFGTRKGPDRSRFDLQKLQGLKVEINVDSGTDFTAAHRGDYYGLKYDATSGIMTVDLSDTTNTTFFVEDIAPAQVDPAVGQVNVIGDSQVRVRGYFHPDVCY